jgi:hypothetical protein
MADEDVLVENIMFSMNRLTERVKKSQQEIARLQRENAAQAQLIEEMRTDLAHAIAIGLRAGRLVDDLAAVAPVSGAAKEDRQNG